jgi:hypothetical protein
MTALASEVAHLEEVINELAAHVFSESVDLASANGDLTGSIKIALNSLRSGNAMKAQTVLQSALERSRP